MMTVLPARPDKDSEPIDAEVVDAEIVGLPPPRPPWWRRILARAALALVLGIAGVGLCLIGALLTITIIGAAIGIPLLLAGIGILVVLLFLLLGSGRITVIR